MDFLLSALFGGLLSLIEELGNWTHSLPPLVLSVSLGALALSKGERFLPRFLTWMLAGAMIVHATLWCRLFMVFLLDWRFDGSGILGLAYTVLPGAAAGIICARLDRGGAVRRVCLATGISLGELYSLQIGSGWWSNDFFGTILGGFQLLAPTVFAGIMGLLSSPLSAFGKRLWSFFMRTDAVSTSLADSASRRIWVIKILIALLVIACIAWVLHRSIEGQEVKSPTVIAGYIGGTVFSVGLCGLTYLSGALVMLSAWRIYRSQIVKAPGRPKKLMMLSIMVVSRAWKESMFGFTLSVQCLFVGAWFGFYGHTFPAIVFALFGVCLFCWLLVRIFSPPTVVFLATSSSDTIRIHLELCEIVRPLRGVALLDSHQAGPLFRSYDTRVFFDCLRTIDADDWRSVVYILLEMVPIVVIDGRTPSAGVIHEASHLLSQGYAYKTVMITDDRGECPAYAAVRVEERSESPAFLTKNQTTQLVRKLIQSKWTLPTPSKPIRV